MSIYALIVSICWAVFIGYWLLSALNAKRTINGPWRWIFTRLAIIIIMIVILENGFAQRFTQYHLSTVTHPALPFIGTFLCIIGIAGAIWARVYLGRNWGMPQSIKENPELVTAGPYTYVRHPIYTGVLLAMLGSALTSDPVWLILTVVFGIYFIYSAFQEEKLMLKTFPDSYPGYKKRTKMLIPFIF